jgi:hypothetical protein
MNSTICRRIVSCLSGGREGSAGFCVMERGHPGGDCGVTSCNESAHLRHPSSSRRADLALSLYWSWRPPGARVFPHAASASSLPRP